MGKENVKKRVGTGEEEKQLSAMLLNAIKRSITDGI